MLRIYETCLDMVGRVRPLVVEISRFDKDHARQLRRSALSVALNVAEASGVRDGNRRMRHETALGSARETRANIDVARAIGFASADPTLDAQLDSIIKVLFTLTR